MMQIQQKAMTTFEEMKRKAVEEGDELAKEVSFKASPGWFSRFKTRAMQHIINITGETASARRESASEFPSHLQKIIDEGGFTAKQIFNVDETGLFWKRMPSRTFISQEEMRVPGHKASKDRLTLLLGSNCVGDVNLKPLLVYHSENPHALKGMIKGKLTVIWRANHKAWVMKEVFRDYIESCLSPFIKEYTTKQNLVNKALLIIDNALGHPASVIEYGDNIQIVFLPPNTMSLLQPMDQGVIAAFKAYYAQLLMQYLVHKEASLRDLWKDFNIRTAIEFIDKAWQKVSPQTMNCVWKKLTPRFVDDFEGFQEVVDAKAKIVALAKKAFKK